jgi:hypothetical protein
MRSYFGDTTLARRVHWSYRQLMSSQKYLKFETTGRLSDDLVIETRAMEDDRWRLSQSCLAAC